MCFGPEIREVTLFILDTLANSENPDERSHKAAFPKIKTYLYQNKYIILNEILTDNTFNPFPNE